MSNQSWVQTLVSAQIDGTAVANTTTVTSILPPAARYTLPSNYLQVGSVLRLRAYGRISTVVTSPGTLAFAWMFGATGTTAWYTTQNIALNVTAQTNATWALELMLTQRAIGAAGVAAIIGAGRFLSRASLGAPAIATANGVGEVLIPDTAPAQVIAGDTTIANVVDFAAQWSTANASNSIQLHQYTLESMN